MLKRKMKEDEEEDSRIKREEEEYSRAKRVRTGGRAQRTNSAKPRKAASHQA